MSTDTLIGLLPCPWCGSSGKLSPPEPVTAPHKDWWTVVCSSPECQMDSAYAGDSSQECIQVWNTRVSVNQMDANHHRESVRCMSKVFNDLAHELGISKEKYGDPELLFDAISNLKEKHAYSEIPVNDTTKERCVADDQWAIDAFYEGYERANADFKANGFSGLKPIIGGIRSLLATVNTTKREVSSGWQPIETLPNDKLNDDIFAAYFNSRGDCCWVMLKRTLEQVRKMMEKPTHWMYVPAITQIEDQSPK